MKTSIRHHRPPCRPWTAPSPHGVIAALRSRGQSVLSWAQAHAYAPSSVYIVINRWIDHPDRRGRLPLGGVSREIARALREELGPELIPLPPTATPTAPPSTPPAGGRPRQRTAP
ncbi:MAG: hypothetical protein IPN92_07070 [Chromatiaceae bacterium]|nr:hypothetical protein [Chromatiaceae bacterium]